MQLLMMVHVFMLKIKVGVIVMKTLWIVLESELPPPEETERATVPTSP